MPQHHPETLPPPPTPYLAGSIVRMLDTGEFARIIEPIYQKDGQGFLQMYHAEIEGRPGKGYWVLHHEKIELECPPKTSEE